MSISEVFPNPTVKKVILQIRFPNLFYMENKIGDLQMKIMKEFPESALLYRTQIVVADLGPEEKPSDFDKAKGKKIWQFTSSKDVKLNILNDSLDISSEYHKTYNLGEADKFRDVIKFVLDCFLEIAAIPIINRIGLRYIDECPIPSKDNDTFRSYYNSVFPLDRFNLVDANEMDFRTMIKKGEYYLRYIESLQKADDGYKLILDFDSFGEKIDPKDYLQVADSLHTIISDEYEITIKEPVRVYMRQVKES